MSATSYCAESPPGRIDGGDQLLTCLGIAMSWVPVGDLAAQVGQQEQGTLGDGGLGFRVPRQRAKGRLGGDLQATQLETKAIDLDR